MADSRLRTWRTPLIAGACMSLLAVLMQLSSPIGSAVPWYAWLFAPGLLGQLAVGGGLAPVWLRVVAALLAVATFWTVIARLLLNALRHNRARNARLIS